MCFSPHLGIGHTGGGGVKRDWYSSKIEVFETYFLDIVIT